MKNNLTDLFVSLFEREIGKLETEIRNYHDESVIWKIDGDIKNAAGNLCLHLCGNLQHFIGAVLGKSGYQRNRSFEFSANGISQTKLLEEIEQTKKVVLATLKTIPEESIHELYPEEALGYPMTTVYFLNHLFGHFNYHLGQINYHRRLMDIPKPD